jgi:hypothetical protein
LTIKEDEANNETCIAELAHIYPDRNGARFDEVAKDGITRDFIDSYQNRIILCPTCHTIIDKMPVRFYTAKYLFEKKKEHEAWVEKQLTEKTIGITIAELETICKAILSGQHEEWNATRDDFSVPGIEKKINKNSLSAVIKNRIATGLARAPFVDNYLANHSDVYFVQNLISAFKNKYTELKKIYTRDELYTELCTSVSSSNDFDMMAATNTVVSYLFHKCEIFEK